LQRFVIPPPALAAFRRESMCGIIGYVGTRDVVPVLIGGLKKLEYRGYDSAGVAVVSGILGGEDVEEGTRAYARALQ
jgi:asparagine synthetase B (glutamine-hydrolysing)